MTDTPTPRQLPGVKGQWILTADFPPNELAKYEVTLEEQYWRPHHHADPRPFTLPAETMQAPAGERKFVHVTGIQMKGNREIIYAVADDGTAWFVDNEAWRQLPSLPDREVG